MATIVKSGIWVLMIVVGLMVSPSESKTCSSQTFSNNKAFDNCTDLPYLGAYLHWTYTASNSTLSMAFLAKPPQTDGWVAWAINPTSTKMAGSQALLAYKNNGSPTVKTFNISSYNFSAAGTKLSYEVSELSSEESGGTITIFAKWKLPEKIEKINQVWQVGPVMQGVPGIHNTKGDNLLSGEALQLLGSGGSSSPTPSPAPGPGSPAPGSITPAPSNGSTPNSSSSRITVGFNVGLLFLVVSIARLMGL